MHFYNKVYIMNYCIIELTMLFYKFYFRNQTFKNKFKNTWPQNERNTALLVVMDRPGLTPPVAEHSEDTLPDLIDVPHGITVPPRPFQKY